MNQSYFKIFLYLSFIIFFVFWVKFFSFYVLPDKYFYDSNFIVELIKSNSSIEDKAFDFTSKIFSIFFYIFPVYDLSFWSLLLQIYYSILLIFLLVKFPPKFNYSFLIVFPLTYFLLILYTANVSKDFIQVNIYFLILLIFYYFQNERKIVFAVMLLITLSYFFRSYLIIVAFLYLFLYFTFYRKRLIIPRVLLLLILTITGLYILQNLYPEKVKVLYNVRETINYDRANSSDAITMISNVINPITNPILFLFNVILSFFNLLYPISLLKIVSAKYIGYTLFQIYISSMIFFKLKKFFYLSEFEKNNLIFLISLYLTHSIFEPDFGSFVRHEISFFPLLYAILFYKNPHKYKRFSYEKR